MILFFFEHLEETEISDLFFSFLFFLVLCCSIGLFCCDDKAKLFVPNAEEKKCAIVSSKTGKLIDIDVEAVKNTVQIFSMPLALATA